MIGWPLNILFSFLIFKIEGNHEEDVREAFKKKEAEFDTKLNEFIDQYNMSTEVAENIYNFLIESRSFVQDDPGDKKWSLLSAMAFVAETGTTIGFGTITPKTDEGKLLTIIIAVVMVPFMAFGVGVAGSGGYQYMYLV